MTLPLKLKNRIKRKIFKKGGLRGFPVTDIVEESVYHRLEKIWRFVLVVFIILSRSRALGQRGMGKLYFRHGAVSSAKTLNLLAVSHNYKSQGKQVLLLKPAVGVLCRIPCSCVVG